MSDRDLNDLDPKLRPLAQMFLDKANTLVAPATVKITQTWRDAAEQNECAAEGLSQAVAGQSPHNCTLADGTPAARAFDWSIFDPEGDYIADGTDVRYSICGAVVELLGLIWGKRFKKPDYDHAELPDWRSAA